MSEYLFSRQNSVVGPSRGGWGSLTDESGKVAWPTPETAQRLGLSPETLNLLLNGIDSDIIAAERASQQNPDTNRIGQ